MSTEQPTGTDPSAVADLLARVRAGVRQRQAVEATRSDSTRSFLVVLEELRASQTLTLPTPTTHRGLLGAPMVAAKRLVFRFFTRWYLRPLVEQQNRFNQAVADAVQELAARHVELQQEIERAGVPRP